MHQTLRDDCVYLSFLWNPRSKLEPKTAREQYIYVCALLKKKEEERMNITISREPREEYAVLLVTVNRGA